MSTGRLLKETLATIGWDVLHPARVSPKMERKIFSRVSLALSRLPDVLHFLTFYAVPSLGRG
jgi:hypothetical protein